MTSTRIEMVVFFVILLIHCNKWTHNLLYFPSNKTFENLKIFLKKSWVRSMKIKHSRVWVFSLNYNQAKLWRRSNHLWYFTSPTILATEKSKKSFSNFNANWKVVLLYFLFVSKNRKEGNLTKFNIMDNENSKRLSLP